jgi:23S rRNA U2552 (ribose-2'-O)-methylase RlmE/FtsJ
MADFTPVSQQLNTGDVFGTLNNVLGLQQKRQSLVQQAQQIETGKYLQSTAKAESEQATLSNEALQRTQSALIKKANSGGYVDANGNFDGVAASNDALSIGGIYAAPHANQLVSNAHEVTQNKQAMQTLNADQQKQLSTRLQALANTKVDATGKSTLTNTDIINELDAIADTNPQLRRMAISTAAHLPQNATSEQLQDMLMKYGESVMTPGEAVGAGLPEGTTNAASQIVNRNKMRGAIAMPPGTTPQVNPPSSTVAGATAANVGGVASDVDTYNKVRDAGTAAQRVSGLANQVTNLAQTVDTGWGTKGMATIWQTAANLTGLNSADIDKDSTRRQILSKLTAQLKAEAESAAPSDTARRAIDEAFPSPDKFGSGAVAEAARYVKSGADLSAERLRNAEAFRKINGNNVTGLSTRDSAFMNHADPYAHQYNNTPDAEKAKFLAAHYTKANGEKDVAGVKKLVEDANALKHSKASNDALLSE